MIRKNDLVSSSSPIDLGQFTKAAQKSGKGKIFILNSNNRVIAKHHDGYLDETSKESNRRTWEVFEKSLRDAFSPQRFTNTCNRYKINFQRAKEEGLPLTSRVIEAVGIASQCVTTYQLKEEFSKENNVPFDRIKLKDHSILELQRAYQEATQYGYLGKDLPDPEEISGGPIDEAEYFYQSYRTMDQRRCKLFENIENLVSSDPNVPDHHRYISRLTMAIGSLLETQEGHEDKKIIIPALGRKKGEVDFYKIYKIISYGGLTAIAFVPVSEESTLSPLIMFRCTKQSFGQTDSVPSVLNDFENEIGKTGYQQSKKLLDELIEDSKFLRGKKPIVTCYSLGESHATYFIRDHWKEMSEFVAFDGVGNNDVVEQIATEINALDKDRVPPPIYHYRNRGDLISFVGKKHIGWGIEHPKAIVQVIEFIIDNYPMVDEQNMFIGIRDLLNLHGIRAMDAKRSYRYRIFRGKECSAILNNKDYKPSIEKMRRKIGTNFLYGIINVIYQILDFIFRLYGIRFFRKNEK